MTHPVDTVQEFDGVRVLVCVEDGETVRSEREAVDLIAAAGQADAEWVAVPVARLDPAFFQLRTRVAGDIAQKFANYRARLAVVGDVSEYVAASDALRDFVRETNRGGQLWFVPGLDAFAAKLKG